MQASLNIKELSCAYYADHPVFDVRDLHFAPGQLTFILGRSGIGKSTLLELTGLMSYPQGGVKGDIVFHHPGKGKISLLDLWRTDDEGVASFRNRHLAFIFQDTNFLDHFTCIENMLLPCLVQGLPLEEAKSRVHSLMTSLSLPDKLSDSFPAYASGGQRQRMAFIRALASDFDILFGDEPTGNLDPVTAQQLMKVLRDHVHDRQRIGIVVSHDIGLASRFADQILVFSALKDGTGCGTILAEDRFHRNEDGTWRTIRTDDLQVDMATHLAELIGQEQPNYQA